MTARDWFGVAARVLGVWLLIQAVTTLVTALAMQRGWGGYEPESGLAKYRLALGAANLVFGILLIARAQFFMDLAYPENEEDAADPGDDLSSDAGPGGDDNL